MNPFGINKTGRKLPRKTVDFFIETVDFAIEKGDFALENRYFAQIRTTSPEAIPPAI